jgi:hypothetical protein
MKRANDIIAVLTLAVVTVAIVLASTGYASWGDKQKGAMQTTRGVTRGK